MSNNTHIADVELTLYAIGALLPAESAPIKAHLDRCARCSEEVRQSTIALAAYAQTTPEVSMPEGAKARFMSKLATTPQYEVMQKTFSVPGLTQEPAKASGWRRFFGGTSLWAPVLTGGLVVALLFIGVDDLNKRAELVPLAAQVRRGSLDSAQLAQMMDLLTSPQAKTVALHTGAVKAPPPEGRVVYAARTGKLLLTASNLSPLPSGKTYELWILQPGGKAPLASGLFTPDSKGYATMVLPNAPAGLTVAGFGVTIEDAAGSATPTLPIVLSGL